MRPTVLGHHIERNIRPADPQDDPPLHTPAEWAALTGNPTHCYRCQRPVPPCVTGCPHCNRSFLD